MRAYIASVTEAPRRPAEGAGIEQTGARRRELPPVVIRRAAAQRVSSAIKLKSRQAGARSGNGKANGGRLLSAIKVEEGRW